MTDRTPPADYSDLSALYFNCTLKRSPELSHTQGVAVDAIRFIDHDIATGVYLDMREHGKDTDGWPDDVWPRILEPRAYGPDAEGRGRDPRLRQSAARLERRRTVGPRGKPGISLRLLSSVGIRGWRPELTPGPTGVARALGAGSR